MKILPKSMIILNMILGLILAFSVDSTAIGPEGNRVTGSVDDKDTNKALGGVRVSFHNRANPYDITGANGVFYLIVPKDINLFRLDFVKDGYASKKSERDYRSDDPVKHHRVQLEKPDPDMNRQQFQSFIDNELNIYPSTSAPSKATIRANMNELATQSWVMSDNFKYSLVCGALKQMRYY